MTSVPLASAIGVEHHHPILGMLGGHVDQVNRERYICPPPLPHLLDIEGEEGEDTKEAKGKDGG